MYYLQYTVIFILIETVDWQQGPPQSFIAVGGLLTLPFARVSVCREVIWFVQLFANCCKISSSDRLPQSNSEETEIEKNQQGLFQSVSSAAGMLTRINFPYLSSFEKRRN